MEATNLELATQVHKKLLKADELLNYIENKDARVPDSAWPSKLVFVRTVKHTHTVVTEEFEIPLSSIYAVLRAETAKYREMLIAFGIEL